MDKHQFSARRRIWGGTMRGLMLLCAAVTCALAVFLIVYVLVKGVPNLSWQLLSTKPSYLDGSIGILTLMVKAGLAASNGEARRLVVQGGVLVDGEKVAAPTVGFTAEQLAKGIVIKKGKKIYHKVTL